MSLQHQHRRLSKKRLDRSTPSLLPTSPAYDTQKTRISDPEQILYLQRTIGNYATRQLLQRQVDPKFIQRDGALLLDDEFDDDDDYDEDEDDDDEVVVDYDTGGLDLPTLRDEMQTMGYEAFVDEYGFGVVNPVLKHIIEQLLSGGEEAITGDELEILYGRFTRLQHLFDYDMAAIFAVAPTLQMRSETDKEAAKLADLKANEAYMMEFLRDHDIGFSSNVETHLLRAKQYYDNPPTDFEQIDELRGQLESEKWSWLLVDGIQTRDDIRALVTARSALEDSEKDADDTSLDVLTSTIEGSTQSAVLVSQGMTVARGVDILSSIDKETTGKEMVTAGMETMFSKIMGYTFAPLAIGTDLIRAFYYNKRRRDGYESAMERSGIDKDGHTDVKPDTAEDVEKIRLGRVAHYAFKKTRRAYWGSIVRASLKIVKWVAHAITLLSGGTTALVTGAIAVSADITRSLMAIGTKLKGLYKALSGKRGAMRKKQAGELLSLAKSGNDDAIQTIWDVNPFDEMSTGVKKAWNATDGLGFFAKSTELPKPESVADLKESLQTGYYSNPKHYTVLLAALKNSMKS